MPKVIIIVLNWNGHADTIACVDSLRKLNYPDYVIIIVDNGSTDDSERILREGNPDVTLIQTGRNLGYAGGVNAGLRYALGNGADYILILNNDTVVEKDAVRELVRIARGDSRIGLLSSKIYYYNRSEVIWYAGATFNTLLGWGRHRGYDQKDTGQFNKAEESGRPCGCSMMVTRNFCETIGLLDEDYFCYCEETDWGLRGKKAGFKIMYVPGSKVWHKVSSSTGGKATGLYLYYSVRNTLMCVDKNTPLPWGVGHLRYLLIILIFLLSLFTMKVPKKLGVTRIYQGVRDYLNGNMGKFEGRVSSSR